MGVKTDGNGGQRGDKYLVHNTGKKRKRGRLKTVR